MTSRFYSQGQQIAEHEIGVHEIEQQRFKDYTPENLEVKPITVKAYAYEIEALDYLASKLGDNRSNFVQQLFLDFMAVAFTDYVRGYDSVLKTDKALAESVTEFLNLNESLLSPAAKHLLTILVEEACKDA